MEEITHITKDAAVMDYDSIKNSLFYVTDPVENPLLSIQDILKDKSESEIDKGVICPNEITKIPDSSFWDVKSDELMSTLVPLSDACFMCSKQINADSTKSYIFSKSDQENIKKWHSKKTLVISKIICDDCLKKHFIQCFVDTLNIGEYLIIKGSNHFVYKTLSSENFYEILQTLYNDIKSSPTNSISTFFSSNIQASHKEKLEKQNKKQSNRKSQIQGKVFQCHICSKQLTRRSRLQAHIERHQSKSKEPAKIFTCSDCRMAFKCLQEAQIHVTGKECGSDFKQLEENDDNEKNAVKLKVDQNNESLCTSNLNITMDTGTENKIGVIVTETDRVYRCEYCENVYCDRKSLNIHRKIHNGVKNPYKCSVCGASFPSYSQCSSHKILHKIPRSGNRLVEISNDNLNLQHDKFPVMKLFSCESCQKTFFDQSYFVNHNKTAHGNNNCNKHKCLECNQLFVNRWCYKYHKGKHLRNDGSSNTSNNRSNPEIISTEPSYRCSDCSDTFIHASALRLHKRKAHQMKTEVSCIHCGKIFYSNHTLKRHLIVHSDDRPFACSVCDKRFRNISGLNEHTKVHIDERPFTCDICGLKFKRARAVKSHRLLHKKKRQFKCSYCQKLFNKQSILDSHMKIHKKGNNEIEESKEETSKENFVYKEAKTGDVCLNQDVKNINQIDPFDEFNSSTFVDNYQDVVFIQDDLNLTDGSCFISCENEILNGVSEGDYVIFNDDGNEDSIWSSF